MMVKNGDTSDAIRNAIKDYTHSAKKSKTDTVYYVFAEDVTNDVIGVNIYGTNNKICVVTEDSINYSYHAFPSDFTEVDKNLYYWHDSTKTVTNEIISILNDYNLIDTTILNVYIPAMEISHNKGMDYYFCRNNLMKYKKIWTLSAMGYYDPPKLRCVEK